MGIVLDLQLPVQSVPITTKFVSLNPEHGKKYSMLLKRKQNTIKYCAMQMNFVFIFKDQFNMVRVVVLNAISMNIYTRQAKPYAY
jgi:hypothetical protein